ncbi:MAG: SGNH/GDSL hydrolase family protein [Acutalibacteraceae bacterium]|nr:SGNH/GDSL hydrolase family protein [Acutalibacteraceae bacterium]
MFIPYTNENFVFTGIWQENGKDEIVNYKTAAFFEIGFTGTLVTLVSNRDNVIEAYIDGKKVDPMPCGNKYQYEAGKGEHLLKVCIRLENHLKLKGIEIGDEEKVFAPPSRPYIHIIGDSITQAYPGYSTVLGENWGGDYSIVAQGGMAVCDGFGWYTIPQGMDARVGMESNYFKLEFPFENINSGDYRFTYCRQPDVVTVYLGTNDFLDNPTHWENGNLDIFYPKYATFLARIREHYPKARIYVLNALSDKMFRRQGIEKAFEEACKTVDNIYLLNIQDWGIEVSEDGTHPSLAGYTDMGLKLAKYIKEDFNK